MTNEEKFKTIEERCDAYNRFCGGQNSCIDCIIHEKKRDKDGCAFYWLALEAEEDKPIGCPFCGCSDTATFKTNERHAVQCTACKATVFSDTKADAIAAWNRRVK